MSPTAPHAPQPGYIRRVYFQLPLGIRLFRDQALYPRALKPGQPAWTLNLNFLHRASLLLTQDNPQDLSEYGPDFRCRPSGWVFGFAFAPYWLGLVVRRVT